LVATFHPTSKENLGKNFPYYCPISPTESSKQSEDVPQTLIYPEKIPFFAQLFQKFKKLRI